MSLRQRTLRKFYGLRAPQTGVHDEPAALGGPALRDKRIPWPKWPVHGTKERIELMRTLEGGNWWYGARVAKFEERYAEFQGGKYCVTCSTGTIALEVMMQVLGVRHGPNPAEVIVPAFTFIATASAVARMGGKPVFVDVDDSWCLDPERVKEAINEHTKAILPVHFAGRVADMDQLNQIAREHDLTVMEDACHSWGSQWKGKGTGALSTGGAFSFQMFKNLTAAEGGAIVTDDEGFADACRSIVNCGRTKDAPWYHHPELGSNARLTEMQGALLLAQLERLPAQTARREENARILDQGLSGIEGLTLQAGDPRVTRHSHHLYCFKIDEAAFGCSRLAFIKACQAEGLPISEMYYPEPVYNQPIFKQLQPEQPHACPVSEDLAWRSAAWLNHWLLLGTSEDMQDIIQIVRKVKHHAPKLASLDCKAGRE